AHARERRHDASVASVLIFSRQRAREPLERVDSLLGSTELRESLAYLIAPDKNAGHVTFMPSVEVVNDEATHDRIYVMYHLVQYVGDLDRLFARHPAQLCRVD